MSLIVNFYQFNVDWFLDLSICYWFWLLKFIIIGFWLNFKAHFSYLILVTYLNYDLLYITVIEIKRQSILFIIY